MTTRIRSTALLGAIFLAACGGDPPGPGAEPGAGGPDTASSGSAASPDVSAGGVADGGQGPDVNLAPDGAGAPGDGGTEPEPLRLSMVDPPQGPTKGGNVVTLVGTGFVEDSVSVIFGASQALDAFVISDTRLTAVVPPGNAGLVDVTVVDAATQQNAVLQFGYRYESEVLLLGVDPPTGHVGGGEPVTVTGSGLSQGKVTVLFGDRSALNVSVVDDFTLHVTTPSGTHVGSVDVHVATSRGSAALQDGFEYWREPRLDALAPAAGPASGGNRVRLIGAGFIDGAVVRFGDSVTGDPTLVDASTLEVWAPAGQENTVVAVSVETAYGTAFRPGAYTYLPGPTTAFGLVAVQPSAGSEDGGETVYVTATGLTTLEDTGVTFDGASGTVLSLDPAAGVVVARTPPHAPGPVDVVLESSAGTASLASAYVYEPAFRVLTVSPVSGPASGGTAVTVSGKGFVPGAEVRIGALPCGGATVVDASTIQCTTPPGSPGSAEVRVTQAGAEAALPDGFFYESGGADLFVVSPPAGSQAGGTFVRLLGAGFEPPVSVRVGSLPATHVTRVSSTLITAKTPPGPVGAADVTVTTANGQATLTDGFTYFDPVALYGGTWGPKVQGAVNVTVLDAGTGEPVADGFVMLRVDPDTPYQGYTNPLGQITFSGPDVLGEQMVSASKANYESASVIEFNATNITIYLTPMSPPSPGGFPPGASISGKVLGLGKYVVVPPGDCSKYPPGSLPNGLCTPCVSDAECPATGATCTAIGGTGSFCTTPCGPGGACPSAFACTTVGASDGGHCIPTPGQKQARCFTTLPSMFSPVPDMAANQIADAQGNYFMSSRLGELAVVCLGGIVSWTNPDDFKPSVYGVRRHLFIQEGANPGIDVVLSHPLGRSLRIRLDDPPFDYITGPEYQGALAFWDLGSDGVFFRTEMQDVTWGDSTESMLIEDQPLSFVGEMYDASFSLLGIAFTASENQLPASYTLITDLKDVDDDAAFWVDAGQWTTQKSGVTRTINAIWGFSDTDIWAVGAGGAILHYNGGGWSLQPSPTDQNLYGIWGPAPGELWAVGKAGTALHFDGIGWSSVTIPGVDGADLRAVWGAAADDVFVTADSWAGTWRLVGGVWTEMSSGTGYFRDLHGASPTAVWAVGLYGYVRRFNGITWSYEYPPGLGSNDLHGVWAVSPDEAYVVGAGGVAARWNGSVWSALATPTKRTLRAVWARGPNDVYAVGDGGVLLHFDGAAWQDQTLPESSDRHTLLALWGDAETGRAVALGSGEILMGPMLQVPKYQKPADGAVMTGFSVGFGVDPGVPAHFNTVNIAIPGAFGDTPVWQIMTDGDVFAFDLPDFENIEGTPGIAAGNTYKLTIRRVYAEDFDIDNYDFLDLSVYRWRSWSVAETLFTK